MSNIEVVRKLWRGEADTPTALAALLGSGTEEHVNASLATLRQAGLVESGEPLRPTARGRSERDAIEMDTDRAFFGPWPDDVGSEAAWITDHLAQVNAALE